MSDIYKDLYDLIVENNPCSTCDDNCPDIYCPFYFVKCFIEENTKTIDINFKNMIQLEMVKEAARKNGISINRFIIDAIEANIPEEE